MVGMAGNFWCIRHAMGVNSKGWADFFSSGPRVGSVGRILGSIPVICAQGGDFAVTCTAVLAASVPFCKKYLLRFHSMPPKLQH